MIAFRTLVHSSKISVYTLHFFRVDDYSMITNRTVIETSVYLANYSKEHRLFISFVL